MISKQGFIRFINAIEEEVKRTDEVSNLLEDKVFDSWVIFKNDFLNRVVSILQDEFYKDGELISWWLWEVEGEDRKVWDENNNEIDLSTPELFYDYLVSCIETYKEQPVEVPIKESKNIMTSDEVFDILKESVESSLNNKQGE